MDAWHRPKKLKTSIIRNVVDEYELEVGTDKLCCIWIGRRINVSL